MRITRYTTMAVLMSGFLVSCADKTEQEEPEMEERRTHPLLAPMGIDAPEDQQGFKDWQLDRLADPATGEIPEGIRAQELMFARNLPVQTERSLTWTQRGPVNKGGRTRTIAMDVLDENTILVGGVTGGIWRSTDGGVNWNKTTDPSHMHSVTSLVQDTRPGHESTWYYGTGEYYAVVSSTSFSSQYSGDGLFKSTDGGLTWTHLTSTSSGTPQTLYNNGDMDFVWRVVTDPTDLVNDVVLAAVYNGIFRSTDGGSSWTAVLGPDTTNSNVSPQVDLIVTPSGIFYASFGDGGPNRGFWRSDDGVNWTNISPSLPSQLGRIAIAHDPQDENVVWWFGQTNGAGTDGHSVWKYRYLSGDGSGSNGTWFNKSSTLPNYNCTGFFTFDFGAINTQSSYDVCVAVHPADSNLIYLGGTNIYRTNNQFNTADSTDWVGGYRCHTPDLSKYVYDNHHPDQHYMIFLPSDPNVMYSANDGGVYRTMDNRADSIVWEDLNNGYVTTQFYTCAIEQGDVSTDYIMGGMQDNGTWWTNTIEFDSAWVELLNGDGSFCAIPEGRPYYLMSKQRGRLHIQNHDGDGNLLSFERIDPTGGPNNYNFINPFELDPNNPDRLYWNGRIRVWRQDSLSFIPQTNQYENTTNMGWTNLTDSYIGISGGYITAIEMCKTAPNTVWYGTSVGKLYRLDSADISEVQVELTSGDFPTGYISSVAVNPFDQDEIMVTFSNYNIPSCFYSNDGGLTWSDVGGNLEENLDGTGAGPAVYWAYLYPDGTKLLGTSIGLFSTSTLDSANTVWAMEGPNEIGNVVINMIDARTFDGQVAVATHGQGVFTANLPPAFVGTPEEALLSFTAYPNPADDELILQWHGINKVDRIQLHSLTGRLVRDERPMQTTGTRLDVGDLSAGVYVVSVQAGERRVVRKVVVR